MMGHPVERAVGRAVPRDRSVTIPMDTGRLTLAQVAGICGVSRVSVWRWCRPARGRPRLKAARAGRYFLIRPRDLETFLAQRGVALVTARQQGEDEDNLALEEGA